MRQASPLNHASYRTPYDGLKPEMKVVDFSNAMLAARLTNKQARLLFIGQRVPTSNERSRAANGNHRKTIHEHIAAAENAMRKLSLKDLRAKAAAKHTHPE